MAQIPEKYPKVITSAGVTPSNAPAINKTEVGSRRAAQQNLFNIPSGEDFETPGVGLPNSPAVIGLTATDAAGNLTTWFLWVNRNGKLRIASTFPVNELSDGVAVGDQTGT